VRSANPAQAQRSNAVARRLLLASIIYLPALLMLMMAERACPAIAGPLPVGSLRYRKSDRLPVGTASPQLTTLFRP